MSVGDRAPQGFVVEALYRRRNGATDSILVCRRKTKAAALRMARRARRDYRDASDHLRVRVRRAEVREAKAKVSR